ncbi:MAG: PKD domain-containing protein [Thermoplasmatales archaeon]|nr:PKD domain-containing protein [Thermoplasmatales archaeon]
MKFLTALPIIFSITISSGCIAYNLIKVDAPRIIQPNEEFEVYINITPCEAIAGAQCNFSFNKDVLIAEDIINGGIFEYWANDIYENFTRIDNQNGSIYNIVAFSSNSTNSEGIFARIVFLAKGEGNSWLDIVDAVISDEEGNKTIIEVINGSIFVDATPPNITFYSPNEFFSRNISLIWGAKDNYSPEEKIFYSYSLDGGEWSEWNNSNETFFELDAGNYTFMLKAKDEAGNLRYENFSFCVRDNSPPEIKNLKIYKINGSVNISCDISDDFGIQEVFLILNGINYSMEKNENYFFNSSLPSGIYNYTIVAIDKSGNKNTSDGNFSINSPPDKPSLISPSNGTTNVGINTILSWQCSDVDGDILTYDIYFGTFSNPPYKETVSNTNYNPGTLSYSTTYYWRIVAKDGEYENSSDIWQFTTMAYTPPTPPPPANLPPACSLNANVSYGYAPLYVNFIMNGSDSDGSIIAWELDVDNDGIAEYSGNSLPSTKSHIYAISGNYTAKLTVRDDKGAISTSNISIFVRANISVDFEFIPIRPAPGVRVNFYSLVEAINYTWQFGDGSIAYGKNVSHSFARDGKYRVKLNVSDGFYYYEKNYTVDVVIPDFYVEARYLPEKPKKGEKITIFLNINNDGGYSENVKCSVFLDGKEQFFSFNISEKYEKEIYAQGISKIKIFVDPENEIEEKNEGNNELEFSIKYAGINLIYLAIIPFIAIVALSYLLLRKKKVVIEEERIEKCSVCLGLFKEEANIIRCDCGALYHKSCAKRVKNCINCGKKL